jgi:drug/metabolite transporter (DMT)-like permease
LTVQASPVNVVLVQLRHILKPSVFVPPNRIPPNRNPKRNMTETTMAKLSSPQGDQESINIPYARTRGLALASGSLGALASCFAKGAFGEFNVTKPNTNAVVHALCLANNSHCLWILMLVYRAICLIAMLACNAMMLGSFVQGMQESGSVAGTSLSNSANFIVSAAMGWLLFQEEYSRMWWFGFCLVLLGTLLLSNVRASVVERRVKED